MKGPLIFAAAAVVVAANCWMLLSVSRNRSGTPGGTVELTERELRLAPIPGESTALFLDLEWDAPSDPPDYRHAPQWLDASKLSELGFDCSLPVTDPGAEDHYRSMITRPVFLVLEYEGQAWKQAPTDRRRQTRLFAIDAGRDADRLREKYADTARFILARGLVRLRFQKYPPQGGQPLPQPRLQGYINTLLPSQIFVPRPYCHLLKDLVDAKEEDLDRTRRDPRFAARISWGTRYEPWITNVRLLGR